MVDYRINLAKTVTSTPAQRRRFYNGMLLYLVICAAGMVYVAYATTLNITEAYRNARIRSKMINTVSISSDFGKAFYKNPDKAYEELELYAADLELLKEAFSQQTHFLPVVNQLFAGLPDDVAVESLEVSAQRKTISFGLVGSSKSVKAQQMAWKQNEALGTRVRGTKQVKGELRMIDGIPVYFVKFECSLK